MSFNGGKAYHGSDVVAGGRLTGTTDTDYFYFFCPRCADRHIMRVLDFETRCDEPVKAYPDEKPKQARDFIIALKLYCSKCQHKDFVKIGNMGWQGGQLPRADA